MINDQQWPADRVEQRSVASLVPYARNARTHSDAQVAQIAASVREWGWTVPVLIDEAGGIIAGHGRVLAARSLGIDAVPVMVAAGWSEAQKRAYVLADNKLALNAGWDTDLLKVELADLRSEGFDLGLTGFGDDELAGFLHSTHGLTDADDAPEVPIAPVSRQGDIWQLGRHRLACGDATRELDVSLLLAGVKPHLMVTDPPYGVNYDAGWRNDALGARDRAVGKVGNDGQADWLGAWSLFPGDVAYVWCAPGPLNVAVHDSLAATGLEPRMQIVWAKSHFPIGRGHYHAQHENCWYAVRSGRVAHWTGDRKQSTLWQIDKPRKSETGHSTQKPVECMRRPMENNSSPGQAVYEPFSGSGTSIIAAEMTGRVCLALEIDPGYVDVAVRRWEAFTGQQATLDGTGETFAVTAAARVAQAAAA